MEALKLMEQPGLKNDCGETYEMVVDDGTEIGELAFDGDQYYFDDYSEGDQTYLGAVHSLAVKKLTHYLDSIGY